MKFSTTSCYQYLHNERARKHYADVHVANIEKTSAGGYRLPDKIIQKIIDAGLGEEYQANMNIARWSPAIKSIAFDEARNIFLDISGIKVFVIRNTVLDIAKKIKIKDEKKFDYLLKAKDGNRILMIDQNKFFKYSKTGGRIVVTYFEGSMGYLYYTMFNWDLDDMYAAKPGDDLATRAERLFVQLIMFMEYAPIEQIILKPKQQNGTRNTEKVLNDTPQNLTIVDSSWNKVIIRTDGFIVGADTGGFLALRACGVGRYDRKFVWIMPFEKEGYVRGLNKEKLLADANKI